MNARQESLGGTVRIARRFWAKRLPYPCSRCSQPVSPTQTWHVDHLIEVALGGSTALSNTGPAHARCNTSAGGRLAAQLRRAKVHSGKGIRLWV